MQNKSSKTKLTHLSAQGALQMVDVSAKPQTTRQAIAIGKIVMQPETLDAIQAGNAPKGNVVTTAKVAGIMAAKQTASLIPLCHPLPLNNIDIDIQPDNALPGFIVTATVITKAETGVEMEALTAVSVSALTLYDMAKALDPAMMITDIVLVQKTGGQSGDYQRNIH